MSAAREFDFALRKMTSCLVEDEGWLEARGSQGGGRAGGGWPESAWEVRGACIGVEAVEIVKNRVRENIGGKAGRIADELNMRTWRQ